MVGIIKSVQDFITGPIHLHNIFLRIASLNLVNDYLINQLSVFASCVGWLTSWSWNLVDGLEVLSVGLVGLVEPLLVIRLEELNQHLISAHSSRLILKSHCTMLDDFAQGLDNSFEIW